MPNASPAAQLSHRFPHHALALAALACLGTAQAEEAANEPAATLETVTVTATRRAESLQSVPVAVSVVSGEQLEQSNRNTLGALATQMPSVNFRIGASNKDTSLFVRGVGTISTSPGVEPTVSTVIDGVVLARPGQATLDLLDVDRVEVLRGAQGTLFGKNASAGVVNISTRAPARTPEGYVDFSHYGGGNENRLRAGVSGELSPGVTASITGLRARYDGNVRNVFNGEDVNGYDKKGLRGRLDWDFGAGRKLSFNADWLQSHDTIPTGVITRSSLIAYPAGTVTNYPAFAAALGPVTASDDNRQINNNLKTTAADRNRGASVQLELPLGNHTLTSITAWRDWQNQQVQDGDRLSAPVVGLPQSHDHGAVDFDQFSQELRLASAQGGSFDYVGGVYYMHTKDRETYRRDVSRVVADGSSFADWGLAHYGTQSDSTALFGEGRWHFAPDTRALLGLRVTEDRLSFEHERSRSTPDAQFNGAIPGVNAVVANQGSTSETGYSGRVGLQHDLSAEASSYLTFSRGYKGPAYNVFFNMLDRDTLALKPETSNSLEAGLKTETFDHRLRVNLAAFVTK